MTNTDTITGYIPPLESVYKASSKESPNSPQGVSFLAEVKDVFNGQTGFKKPTDVSFDFLRKMSQILPMAGICKNTLKNWVSQTDWSLQPIDKEVPQESHYDEVRSLLTKPNRNKESFRTLIDSIVNDLLDCDGGVLEKVRNGYGKVAELWYRDVASIRPIYDENGIAGDPAYAQFTDDYSHPVATWSNDDMIYMMQNPQKSMALFGYGLSPLEIVIFSASTLLSAEQFNSGFFSSTSIPPAIINLGPNATPAQLREFQASWIAMLQGASNKWKSPIIAQDNSQFSITKLRDTNQDMQFMEFTMWLSRIVIASYGLSPQDIGLTMDVNRANGEIQQQISKSKGYKSLLTVIREYINAEIIADFGYENEFTFEWIGIDSLDPETQANIDKTYVAAGIMSGNEVRVKLGLEPLKGLEKPSVMTKNGPVFFDATPLEELSDKELEEVRIANEPNDNSLADAVLDQEQEDTAEAQSEGGQQQAVNPPASKSIKKKRLPISRKPSWTLKKSYPDIYREILKN